MPYTAALRVLNSAMLVGVFSIAKYPSCYTEFDSPSWSGGTGRRTGLKIPRPSLVMRVRPPPPAPGFSGPHQLYRSTQFPCANDLASRLLVVHLLHLSTEAMMLECFLLLRHAAGGRWIPFFA